MDTVQERAIQVRMMLASLEDMKVGMMNSTRLQQSAKELGQDTVV